MRIGKIKSVIYNNTIFFHYLEGLEYINFMNEDGVPWDSMVGIRAIGN